MMNISGRINNVLRGAALWTGLGAVMVVVIILGLGFLVAGGYIALMHRMGPALAAVIVGGGLIVFAVLLLLIGGAIIRKSKKRYPSLVSEFGGTIGLAGRLIGVLVRRDPKKALILSIIAGAVAEYIASERKT